MKKKKEGREWERMRGKKRERKRGRKGGRGERDGAGRILVSLVLYKIPAWMEEKPPNALLTAEQLLAADVCQER